MLPVSCETKHVSTPLTLAILLVEDRVFVTAVVVVVAENDVQDRLVISLELENSSFPVETTVVSILTWLVLINVTPLLPDCETTNDLLGSCALDSVENWV